MTQRHLLLSLLAIISLPAFCQPRLSENEKKYLVYTVQPGQKAVADGLGYEGEATEEPAEEIDSMALWFPYRSLCDWKPGMRFMVMPDKKGLVIKDFAEKSTGRLVSSQTLLHKVMVYQGYDNPDGGHHDHVNFRCEETGTDYYFEVPTASFDDYCYQKFGIPSLAYLDEVDSAIVHLKGKTLLTVADRYYVDDPMAADGCREIHDVKKDTEVEVVAVGVGTRSFPVKIVVREGDEKTGRQFFQNVAISKTNSGLRDNELEVSNMVVHTFNGAFQLTDDRMSVHPLYQKYIGQEVYTLKEMAVKDNRGNTVRLSRLTPLKVKKIRSQSRSEYARMTLVEPASGNEYTKEALFENKNRIGITDNQAQFYVGNLFALGNPKKMSNVRSENMADLKAGMIRKGFTADEVRVALGSPTSTGKQGANTVWIYRDGSDAFGKKVFFNSKTMKVVRVTQ